MKYFFKIAFIFTLAFVINANADVFTQTRIRFVENSFVKNLKDINAKAGGIVIIENCNILLAKNLPIKDNSKQLANFPLGYTSQTLTSLMMSIMKRNLEFDASWIVAKYCSYLRDPYDKASFDDFISMKAGVYNYYDDKIPADCSARELFDILAQFPKSPSNKNEFSRSEISSAIASYALAYMYDKNEKDFKKSFAKCAQEYLFNPLKFEDPKFVNFDSPMFSAKPFALNIKDCAKWLAFETNPNSKIAFKTDVDMRRLSKDKNSNFSQGWLKSEEFDVEFFVSADYFQNCANVVAIFPKENIAIAFFALSKDSKKSTKACANTLSKFIDVILNPNLTN